ncbi:trypsin-like peptidase domain-containing protein [Streptomyces sp. NPDC003077]|uniref:trypsin-like serine peptidase n=1 Tax=Streptomyces sp. NPDC003077 TaxID=3154443 RepID=UPI0033BEDB3A
MRFSRWATAVVIGIGGGLLASGTGGAAAAPVGPVRGGTDTKPQVGPSFTARPEAERLPRTWTSEKAEEFWTARRLASATPVEPERNGPARGGTATPAGNFAVRASAGHSVVRALAAAPATYGSVATVQSAAVRTVAGKGQYFGGIRTVGLLFFMRDGKATPQAMEAHFCTASVVQSPGRNLILTAGHCIGGSNAVFIPQYKQGKSAEQQPFGAFPLDRWFRDSRYPANLRGPQSDLDFAFGRVKPNSARKPVETAVGGANKLTRTPSYNTTVTVIGYPHHKHNPGDQAIKCDRAATTRLTGYQQMRMDCAGFYGGTSGSPWLLDFNTATGTGKVVGNIGGWNGGGRADNSDRISFSPFYGDDIFKLYDDAVHDRASNRGKTPYSMHGEGGSTWQNARYLAAGDFTGDGRGDLLAVWADGGVTVYHGDGLGGFNGESRLQGSNKNWQNVRAVTGGSFTGGKLSDLVVRFADGKLSLFTDVSPTTKFGKETQLARSSTWQHADQIVAGRFNGSQAIDDLVVRWSDGEISLYTDVNPANKVTKEKRLQPAAASWKQATMLVSGNFAGNANSDIMVRWADGTRELYQDVSQSTTFKAGTGKKLQAKNNLWPNSRAAVAGSFTANGRPDDLVVRWSDGELSLYAETTTALGKERQLVPPKVN